jgi:hypothetical protein
MTIITSRSGALRQRYGRNAWIATAACPILVYYILGLSILKIPGALLYFAPISQSTEVVTVGEYAGKCGVSSVTTQEHPFFLQSCLYSSEQLQPGERIELHGKKGLGGFLVVRYKRAANQSLQPPGFASD